MKIRTGDVVIVIAGKDKGKQGTVTRVLAEKNRLVVEGINMRVRHIKKTSQGPGQRVRFAANLHASNVMILDPKSKKPTRVGYKVDAKTGNKQRIAKASGEVIVKAVTKAAKKTKTDAPKSADAKEGAATSPKAPFWKRGKSGSQSQDSGSGAQEGGANSFTTAHRSQGG